MKKELETSIGCTEPSALAFCVLFSKTQLPNEKIEKINLGLSSNILKNALCVTIPNTNLSGIDIIVLLGLIKEECKNKYEILKGISEEDIIKVTQLSKKLKINIKLIENVDPLYINVELKTKNHKVKTIIEHTHDQIKECFLDDRLIFNNNSDVSNKHSVNIMFDDIYDFVKNHKYDAELIKKADYFNTDIAEYGLLNDVGLSVGKIMSNFDLYSKNYNSLISKTVAGIDSRMSGVSKSVIINSGSGNQGITATVPIVEFAKNNNICEETKLDAIAFSHLVTIYIRSKQSKLSSSCGVIGAGAGVTAGISYMLGCNIDQIKNAIKSFLCSNFGVFCDGAKVTCSLKAASAVSSAINCALLSKNNMMINDNYGIISKSFDDTIESISKIEKKLTMTMDKTIMEIASKNKNITIL